MKVGHLARVFQSLGLLEIIEIFYQSVEQPTFHEERHQIDKVWVSPLLKPYTSSIALFYLGIGDYRIFIIDFPIELVIGDRFILICRPSMRRLISCHPSSVSNYIQHLEFLFKYYRIKEKLDALEDRWSFTSTSQREEQINAIDLQSTQLLLCSEKKCHKL